MGAIARAELRCGWTSIFQTRSSGLCCACIGAVCGDLLLAGHWTSLVHVLGLDGWRSDHVRVGFLLPHFFVEATLLDADFDDLVTR